MQIDKRTLQALLAMNDAQLAAVLAKVGKEAGIGPEMLGASAGDLASVRRALSAATDEDLKKMNELYSAYRKNKGH